MGDPTKADVTCEISAIGAPVRGDVVTGVGNAVTVAGDGVCIGGVVY